MQLSFFPGWPEQAHLEWAVQGDRLLRRGGAGVGCTGSHGHQVKAGRKISAYRDSPQAPCVCAEQGKYCSHHHHQQPLPVHCQFIAEGTTFFTTLWHHYIQGEILLGPGFLSFSRVKWIENKWLFIHSQNYITKLLRLLTPLLMSTCTPLLPLS